ncbi:hypothetical protein A4X09_0g7128 [Tilletia walkeri]|uniref:RGS domain-containing protein n=1 Tax=Tilletia walkeri TaxID=117179 RepID=A0A8X7N2G6_9BASI|nr:hypothetical protein A4X09_0g7128 [Tilletia walkeri]
MPAIPVEDLAHTHAAQTHRKGEHSSSSKVRHRLPVLPAPTYPLPVAPELDAKQSSTPDIKHKLPVVPSSRIPLSVASESAAKPSSRANYQSSGNQLSTLTAAQGLVSTRSPRGIPRKLSKDTFGNMSYSSHSKVDQERGSSDQSKSSSPCEDEDDYFPDGEIERDHGMMRLNNGRLTNQVVVSGFPMPPARGPSQAFSSPRMDHRDAPGSPSAHRFRNHSSQGNLRQNIVGRTPPGYRRRQLSGLDQDNSTLVSESRPESVSSHDSSTPGLDRRTDARTGIEAWDPPAPPTVSSTFLQGSQSPMPNLPDWASLRDKEQTSHPTSLVQKDVEYSILRLISPVVFEKFLSDPLGRHRFREHLGTTNEGTKALDFLLDVGEHIRALGNVERGSKALYDVYIRDPDIHIELPADLHTSLVVSLRSISGLHHQLEGVHSHLVQTMFNSAFQRFIRASITEHSRVRLGALATNDNGDGLGAAFVLTNPRLRDHPIVLVSPAFCELTGYPQEAILQRNCRFLQGPSTSPASVQRIRDSLNTGTPSVELLLNYKRNGEPFWNLLCIIPLRDAKGRVQYFVGGQVNVTGALTTEGLSFLLGGGRSYENLPDPETTRLYGVEASPTLLKYYSSTDLSSDQKKRAESDQGSIWQRGGQAAGAQLYGPDDFSPAASGKSKSQHDLGIGTKSGNSGYMRRLWQRRKESPSQSLGRTAESEARRTGNTLEDHIDDFAATYSRLALVKKEKREVLFVTSSLLEFFDLPINTPQQIYESSLLHVDLLSLVCGEDRNDTKRLRGDIQVAIRTGRTLKIAVKVHQPARGLFGSSTALKSSVLHISPLKDVENNASAVIVVFT